MTGFKEFQPIDEFNPGEETRSIEKNVRKWMPNFNTEEKFSKDLKY